MKKTKLSISFNKSISIMMLVLWDVAVAILAVSIAAFLTFNNLGVPNGFLLFDSYVLVASMLLLLFSVLFRCYNNIWRFAGVNELVRQFFAVFISSAAFAVILTIKFESGTAIEIAAIASVVELMLTAGVRLLPRLANWFSCMWNKRHTQNQPKRTIIIGAGQAGTYLAKKLQSNMDENYLPVAFIDDDLSIWNKTICGIPVAGGKEKIKDAVQKYRATDIIIAIPSASRSTIKELYNFSEGSKCTIKRYGKMLDVNEKNLENIKIDDINVEDLLGRDVVSLDIKKIQGFIEGKTVLVTGGAGSIGSEICRQVLKQKAAKLVIFDIHENGLFDIDSELKGTYCGLYDTVLGSVRDDERLEEVFSEYRPDIVFHAAAHKHVPMMEWNPKEAIKNNVFGTINVARIADKYDVQKFILISTDKAVNPTNIMGASKRIAEMFIQTFNSQSNTEFAAVRFGNVLGSNGSVIPTFKRQIESGGPVTVTHPDIMRYFMTIPEAVQLVLEAGAMANGGEIFVLDMGEPVKIYDLACTLIRLSGLEPEDDIKIEFTGLRPGEKMFEEINLSNEDVSKTANDKIYVMQSNGYDSKMLFKDIYVLDKIIKNSSIEAVFAQVKLLVPTFDHKTNGYESLDATEAYICEKKAAVKAGAV
ncbi:MAG: NDP-sugar epimerase, includes UDP-GlcNAc-inverting 4,6-dehydratase FlaA1 and capsular polysaccharide biosynthesis protein EpsC [Xylanivirga thermophila]|jgi:FlaA1/EpsC-like NDP-sugar epimerase|uniref:polysaccharide biosynthesis protein n=1 Tax=Xylanivirga thermophila TaxID=2496273 RepID=UPI0039F5F3D4